MKLRYWMVVYPFHMSGAESCKPMPTLQPSEVLEPAKLVSFEVEIPDDLFGTIEISAASASSAEPKS